MSTKSFPTRRLREAGVSLLDCEHRTPKAALSGYPYIAIPDIVDGRLDLRNVRLISEQDYRDWTRKTKPQAGDIIVTRRGRVGDSAVVPPGLECAIGQNLVILRSDGTHIDQAFLRWLVRGPQYWGQVAKFLNVGAVFNSLNCRDIPEFELPIPPLDDQRRIASVLGALDDKIELNRRMNETLEGIARALYKSMFVDLDQYGGKLPAHWRVGTVGEAFNVTMGQSPPGSSYNEDGLGEPFFQGRADFGFRFPRPRVFCTAPTRLAQAGDTLVSVRAPVGDVNMAGTRCCIGRGVAAVRHKSGCRSFTYYAILFLQPALREYEAEGTVFGAIRRRDFERLSHVVPSPEAVNCFETLVQPIDSRIESNEQENNLLAALRDALLPKLLSGEIRIRDAEHQVEQAV